STATGRERLLEFASSLPVAALTVAIGKSRFDNPRRAINFARVAVRRLSNHFAARRVVNSRELRGAGDLQIAADIVVTIVAITNSNSIERL
ncbi:MAG: hypothetical protein ACKVZH_01925, partial [Blastocatellia bacterium]